MQAPSSAPAAWFAQAASLPGVPPLSHGRSSALLRVALLSRRGESQFAVECTDNPAKRRLKTCRVNSLQRDHCDCTWSRKEYKQHAT